MVASWLRKRRAAARQEQSASAVLVAIAIVAIVGMLALVVDGGGLLNMRRRMVMSADSAALAAALSCALEQGQGTAESEADSLATDNVSTATRDSIQWDGGCDEKSGSVTVKYESPQELFFAPVVGLPNSGPVAAQATAIWGPASSGKPVPVMVRSLWIGDCGIPDAPVGTQCNFWMDNSPDELGDAQWSWMNLNLCPVESQCGWDISRTGNCPNVGASERDDWIRNGPDMNLPVSAYVCTTSGHASTNFSDLTSQIGEVKAFPVNDQNQQVDNSGNICSPHSASPDK